MLTMREAYLSFRKIKKQPLSSKPGDGALKLSDAVIAHQAARAGKNLSGRAQTIHICSVAMLSTPYSRPGNGTAEDVFV